MAVRKSGFEEERAKRETTDKGRDFDLSRLDHFLMLISNTVEALVSDHPGN